MFDHLSLGVRDIAAARRFYDALLAPLGHAAVFQRDAELAYGPGGKAPQLFLYAASGDQVAGLGTHIAFSAPNEAAVDAAFAAAIREGAEAVRPAGPHPDIAPDYYGAVLFDPDGNKLEIVRSGDGMAMAA
jgi:catechol 2,3-dioxygenase-like lactoylglutathione lyase family enzyme